MRLLIYVNLVCVCTIAHTSHTSHAHRTSHTRTHTQHTYVTHVRLRNECSVLMFFIYSCCADEFHVLVFIYFMHTHAHARTHTHTHAHTRTHTHAHTRTNTYIIIFHELWLEQCRDEIYKKNYVEKLIAMINLYVLYMSVDMWMSMFDVYT